MAAQALRDPAERGHLVCDVPALLLVAVALAVLTPRGATVIALADRGARRVA